MRDAADKCCLDVCYFCCGEDVFLVTGVMGLVVVCGWVLMEADRKRAAAGFGAH
jgi:hypothetical protein